MIRPARASDEKAIKDCAQRAYARYVSAIGRRPAPMIADFRSQIESGDVYVATGLDDNIQGFIVFFPQGDRMFLENVAVLPAMAGQGIGKALIQFCEDVAQQLGFGSVRLYTNEKMIENLSIYPRLGYIEVDRHTEDGFNRVFFEKMLD